VRAHLQRDPKGGDLYPAMVKPWETVVEARHITDVQIVCLSWCIVAKDSSNHLVAGFLRSFPQDCWSHRQWPRRELCNVEQCMGGPRDALILGLPANCEEARMWPLHCLCHGSPVNAGQDNCHVLPESWTLCGPTSGKQCWRCGMN